MNTKELRIGNFISNGGGIVHVTELDEHGASVVDGEDYASEVYMLINNFSPVPLTPEWLEKFGFIRQADLVENKVWLPNGGISQFHGAEIFRNESYQDVYLDENVFHFILAQDDNQISTIYTSKEIKSVHQLQNLYFALTGEELTIKEHATK